MAKDGSTDEDSKSQDRIKIYAIGAGILIAIALISTVLTNVAVRPGSCGGVIQQSAYNCTERMAYSTSNASLCSNLPSSYADQCYGAVAENTKNESTCAKISNSNESGLCTMYVANETGNANLCRQLNSSLQSSCVEHIAINLRSAGTCTELNNRTQLLTCLSAVYLNDAVNYNSTSSCALIESDNDSAVSYSAMALLNGNPSGNYYNLTQVSGYAAFYNSSIGARDLCYFYLAYQSGNKAYCNRVSDNMSTICNSTAEHFNTIAHNTTATTNFTALMALCQNQASSAQCNETAEYLHAISAKNVTDCNGLTTIYAYQCYFTLAQEYNDTNYCSYITNSTVNNECIESIRNGFNSTLGS